MRRSTGPMQVSARGTWPLIKQPVRNRSLHLHLCSGYFTWGRRPRYAVLVSFQSRRTQGAPKSVF